MNNQHPINTNIAFVEIKILKWSVSIGKFNGLVLKYSEV